MRNRIMGIDSNTIINTETGERIVIQKSGAETGGACLGFDFYAAPGGGVPFEHYHAKQSEYFRMVEGELTLRVDGETRLLRAGDEMTLAPGTRHSIKNEGDVEAHCYVEYHPALKSEWWFRIIHPYQSAIGKEPGLLDLAPFLSKGVETYPARVPLVIGRIVIFVFGMIGRLLGRDRKVMQVVNQGVGQSVGASQSTKSA
jgi:quercetin dioxygenase-like cupin family protein